MKENILAVINEITRRQEELVRLRGGLEGLLRMTEMPIATSIEQTATLQSGPSKEIARAAAKIRQRTAIPSGQLGKAIARPGRVKKARRSRSEGGLKGSVLAAAQKIAGIFSIEDVAKGLPDYTGKQISSACCQLRIAGKLTRSGYGKYSCGPGAAAVNPVADGPATASGNKGDKGERSYEGFVTLVRAGLPIEPFTVDDLKGHVLARAPKIQVPEPWWKSALGLLVDRFELDYERKPQQGMATIYKRV